MSQQTKLLYGVIFASLVVGVGVTWHWIREQTRVYTLQIATGGKSGEYYAFGEALAKIVEKHQPRIKIEVVATKGSNENQELIDSREVELAILQADTTVNPSTQALTFLFPEMFHLIADSDAEINSVSDLKGKKIALMPLGSGSYNVFWPLSQHYGLLERDFEAIPLNSSQAHQALEAGEVDALFRVIAMGNQDVARLLHNPGIDLVPIDQAAALQLVLPGVQPDVIPKGTYNGAVPIPGEDLPVVSVRSVLVADKSLNPQIAKEITRIIFEARNELIRLHRQSAMISKPNHIQELGFSFHEGAKSYYNQDEPSFLERYAESIGLIVSLSMLAASGIWQFRIWLQEKQKNRADQYNLQIINLISEIQVTKSFTRLEEMRRELLDLFTTVVKDLDRDRISSDSFQSFTFPWDVAFNSIRHRELLLRDLMIATEKENATDPTPRS